MCWHIKKDRQENCPHSNLYDSDVSLLSQVILAELKLFQRLHFTRLYHSCILAICLYANSCLQADDTMPYQQFDNDSIQSQLPSSVVRLYRVLKALSQCQVLLGLVSAAMASLYLLNDGVFGIFSVGIFIGIYYAITGFIGICGAASFRRGLVAAYMVMCLHSAIICVPMSIVINAYAVKLDGRGCIIACHTEDLTCGMTCQGDAQW